MCHQSPPYFHGFVFNPLNAQLNPICHLLALLGTHHILHVSRIRVNWARGQLYAIFLQGVSFIMPSEQGSSRGMSSVAARFVYNKTVVIWVTNKETAFTCCLPVETATPTCIFWLQCSLSFLSNSITRISSLLLSFFLKECLGYIPLTHETVHNTWHTIIRLKTMPTYFKHETNRGWELKYKQLVASYICCFPDLFLRVWWY
jgi:hypothetical protein